MTKNTLPIFPEQAQATLLFFNRQRMHYIAEYFSATFVCQRAYARRQVLHYRRLIGGAA